jgi:hypothetical protein
MPGEPDFLDGAVAGLMQPDAVGDDEGLADGVGVPRGARTRGETARR